MNERMKHIISKAIDAAVAAEEWTVVDGGLLDEFERAAAVLFGTRWAIATNNGTNALLAAAAALRLPPGSRILVPSYGFYGMLAPFRFLGISPVLVPVGLDTLCASTSDYSLGLVTEPAAVLVFHPWGNIGPAEEVYQWASDLGMPTIVDLSHAHGALAGDVKIGALGTICAASFGRGKLLTGGELGVCVTDDSLLAARVKALGHPNRPRAPLPEEWGTGDDILTHSYGPKLRPSGLSLAMVLAQFPGFSSLSERRRATAQFMEREAERCGAFEAIPRRTDAIHQFWRLVLKGRRNLPSEAAAILGEFGFPLDGAGYRSLLSDHPIQHSPGAPIIDECLPQAWVEEARRTLRRLIYLDVPEPDVDSEARWKSAMFAVSRLVPQPGR